MVSENQSITLRALTRQNYKAALRLKVAPEQRTFVATAATILSKAIAQEAQVRVVYLGEQPIGLVCWRQLERPGLNCYQLDQFFIDQAHQSHGYGERALEALLALLARERRYPLVQLSYRRGDEQAAGLYHKLGFSAAGYTEEGAEVVLRRRV